MSYDYFAFISYSRKDKAAARYLQNRLESYRYPAVLVDKEYRPENSKYLRKIFRDTSDLEVTRDNFSESIKRNIAGSRYLIVVCSPNSAQSVWVDREIGCFLETHDNNMKAVFPVILEGEVPECLPERLRLPEFLDRNIPTMIPDDASSQKEGWEHGFLQLVSCMLNVSIARITDRFQKAKQAMLRWIIFAISAVLAVTVALTVWALIAEHKAKVAEAKAVAAEKAALHKAKVARSTLDFVKKAFDAADASKSGNKDMTLLEFAKVTSGKLDMLKTPEVKLKVATIVLPLLSGMGDSKIALARMLPLLPEAERQYPADSEARAEFSFIVANLLHANAKYDKALEYYEAALAIRRKKLGDDHPDVAAALNNIGWAYSSKGDYDKAIKHYEEALAVRRKKLGDDHPDVAGSLNNIGWAYSSKGDYDKAIKHYEEALAIKRKTLGNDHPSTANTLNNIGWAYSSKGDYDKAIKHYEEALAIRRKKLGSDHPTTAGSLNNIGLAYSSKGDYDKAIKYYEEALAIRRKKLGGDHPNVAGSLNNIGFAYSRKADYDKSIRYYEEALAIRRKKLGADHPSTANSLNNIGLAYSSKGDYDEAIKYYEEALAIRRKKLGDDHPDVAASLNNIGNAYSSKGSYDKAIKYYEQALAMRRKKLGANHPSTAETEAGLGYALVMKGGAAEGFEMLDHGLAVRNKKLGAEHPDTAKTLYYRGLAHCASAERKAAGTDVRADLQAAEGDLKRALDIREKKLGPRHPDTVKTAKALQRVLELKKSRRAQ